MTEKGFDSPPPGTGGQPAVPELQYSVPCDDFRQEVTGKFFFVGVFEVIRSETFPVTHPALFIVNKWCNGVGDFVERSRIVSAGGEVVAEGRDLGFSLAEAASGYTVVTRFTNLAFAGPGVYWVEVLLDGQVLHRYPLLVEGGG